MGGVADVEKHLRSGVFPLGLVLAGPDNYRGMASQYGNLGHIYLTKRYLDKAEAMFLKSLHLEE